MRRALLLILVLALAGCRPAQHPNAQPTDSLSQLVTEIVRKANAGDTQYFEALLDEPYKGQSAELIEMIKRSEMELNFRQRFEEKSDTTGRLNYHFLEKGCHFQIDLVLDGGTWTVDRIWFCR
jgi:hypothetical protein